MHRFTIALLVLALAPWTLAQENAVGTGPGPTPPKPFVYRPPAGYVAAVDFDTSGAALDALLTTSLGKVAAQEEVAAFITLFRERYTEKEAEMMRLVDLVKGRKEDELVDELANRLMTMGDHPPLRFRAWLFPPEEGEKDGHGLIAVRFGDGAESALAEVLESLKQIVESEDGVSLTETGKLGDGTVYTIEDETDEDLSVWFSLVGTEIWAGIDAEGMHQKLEKGTDAGLAGIWKIAPNAKYRLAGFTVDVARTLAVARREADEDELEKIEKAMAALGADKLSGIHWTATVDGDVVRETMLLETPEAKGLLGALVPRDPGTSTPVDGAPISKPMVIARGSMDTKGVMDAVFALAAIADEESEANLAELPREDVEAAFSGSYALVVGRPSLLSPTPKVALTLGIRDGEALNKLLALAREKAEGITFEETEYREAKLTTVIIPNDASGTAPTFAILGDRFFLSDSPKTLKSIVRDLGKGKALKPLERLPAALPFDGITPAATLEYSVADMVKVLYGQVMTVAQIGLAQMTAQSGMKGLFSLGELPSAATVAGLLTPGSGGAGWREDGLYMSVASPLGDPLLVAFASTGGPMGLWGLGIGMDGGLAALRKQVGGERAQKLARGLASWRSAFGGGQRWPDSLGALLAGGLIEDEEAFLVPGDEKSVEEEYQDQSGAFRKLRTSFRYLPNSKIVVSAKEFGVSALGAGGQFGGNPMDMMGAMSSRVERLDDGEETENVDRTVLLYEHRDCGHGGRIVLFTDGTIYHFPEETFQRIFSQKSR